MKSQSMSFTIKTPHSTIKTKDVAKFNSAFLNEIDKRAVKVTIDNVAKYARVAKRKSVAIVATFFQRAVSRTPLDENYKYYRTTFPKDHPEGVQKEYEHKADNIQCRYDWFIEKNGTRLYARDIVEAYADAFDEVNSKAGINSVLSFIEYTFGDSVYEGEGFSVGNENPYFATLEYGGYKQDGDIKKGKKYEHGVENKHSVQAPVGMLRITQMELEDIFKSGMSVKAYKNEKGVSKNLSNAELETLVKKFKASKRLKLSDIKRYIEL